MHHGLLLLILAAAWLLWSGLYTPLLLAMGAVSVGLAYWIARRMDVFDREVFHLHLIPRLIPYWLWLLVEVVKANVIVLRVVLHPKMPIDPVLIDFRARTRGPVGLTILGNSITLTPGTATLDLDDGRLWVHCLTAATAEGIGEIDRRLAVLSQRLTGP